MDKERVLEKIRKCLALATSGNEHEASAALRQARALMAEHQISDDEMKAVGVTEACTRAGAVENPVRWEQALAGGVARIFGVRLLLVRVAWEVSEWRFIGVSPANDVAMYSFEVLFRQAKRAREQHRKTALKRYKKSNKTRLADLFCEGWVSTALQAVTPLTVSEPETEAIDAFMKVKHPDVSALTARDRNAGKPLSNRGYASLAAGRAAGRDAEINQGVGANPTPLAIGGPQ
ncbi:DUF2786 domain-containing protein [Methyloversatilis discipulorum]|uniref:DUF2786 domain-containing protein n=1 Tax=Methyloversatilis discipulorum TaxID=1119528 RepID=UPI001A5A1BE5|nr:DUF2786 domain-containing protein [Methyloversatilis discipulorum]MBL8467336.1 DUF2786 domain-containing protein [Methyloversatilis discipulorum]